MHPRVLTAHDVLPREPQPGQLAGQRALYERMDAIVVHSEHGAARLRDELGLDPARVHVIPHGALDGLTDAAGGRGAAAGARASAGPVVLFFGLLRPYKGVDVLLEAWRRAERPAGAELWIAGMPRMDVVVRPRRPGVRTALRFVSGAELAGAFRAADLVVLPYREIDQSGVLFTALAFGKPLLLTAVGGFPEIAATGAAELVAARRPRRARGRAHARCSPTRRGWRGWPPRRAPPRTGPYGWDAIARAHARALRGAPGVDGVVERRRALLARRAAALAGVEEPGPLRDPRARRGCPRGSAARSARARARSRAQSRSSVTARVRDAAAARGRGDPVADLAVARRPVELHHAEGAEQRRRSSTARNAAILPARPPRARRARGTRPRARGDTGDGTPVQRWISGSWHSR